MEKIISISNLSIAFNKYTDVVKNVNIDVVKGKTTAIVGELSLIHISEPTRRM